ncbi:hydrolase [Lentzea sp. NBRC 105346]|uniref:alpha/beta fold hydrolase n=1 Tax=Lentzea sp. NBRC 105346 TaxID=3032205 RepID=UPI0024A2C000|nr:alpha/beta hydrolase [Lentzea sp. NBRC 105346]GLZ33408.1 hydrolase [Lentzea sp. NBRC 105346]
MTLDRRKMLALGAGAAVFVTTTAGVASAASVPSDEELARSLGFRSAYARVNGVRLHYVIGGKGAPLLLLPGWPQTWWQYNKILPALARRYRVIVPDLRGMNLSEKPLAGFDKKTMARDVLELTRALGHQSVFVAGHDIGSQVAFSFAANHPTATRKVALLDIAHPDDDYYKLPLLPPPGGFALWWFAFNQVRGLPEQLLAGRFRHLHDWLFDNSLADPASIPDRDRAIYARAYNAPEAIRASNGWYQSFHQDIADLKTYAKIPSPLLAIATDFSYDGFLQKLPSQAIDFRVEKVQSGHWLAEEKPEEVTRLLTDFFA